MQRFDIPLSLSLYPLQRPLRTANLGRRRWVEVKLAQNSAEEKPTPGLQLILGLPEAGERRDPSTDEASPVNRGNPYLDEMHEKK